MNPAVAAPTALYILSLPIVDRGVPKSDKTIVKKRYSAFFGTELEGTLKRIRPEVLVVAGINTHACVRTTVIDAYQRDYKVVVATEGIASYDEVHHDMTKRYLDGAMARLLPNSEIMKMPVS